MSLKRKQVVVSIAMVLGLNAEPIQAQFDPVLDLSSLNGNNGFVINGISQGDYSGLSVSSAGDFNGDGLDDLIVSSPGTSPNAINQAGTSYLIFGVGGAMPATFDLASIDGSNGIAINGINATDYAGLTVNSAGDINGDGFDDLVIASSYADPNGLYNAGSSYVLFGSDSVLPHPFNLNTVDGSNGFVLNGIVDFEGFATAVSFGGDLNGDGIDDLVIGNNRASPGGVSSAGAVYVIFGNDDENGFPNPFNSDTFNGLNGYLITGINIADGAGFSVSQAGDINADGVDDLVIGGPFAHATTGLSYVVFGTTDQQPNPFPLTGLNGINGFFINGEQPGDYAGFSVSGGGDINGDGIDDFMLGTRSISEIGKAYVVFGNNTGFPSTLNLADINGSNGLVILGESAGDFLGKSVSSAGDVNGDGVNDLILGAERANPNGNTYAGTSYVMFGSNSVTTSPFNLADLDGSNGFVMNGGVANSSSGASVDFAGDFNADGVGDIIVGAPIFNSSTGQSYVIYGNDVIFKDGFQ